MMGKRSQIVSIVLFTVRLFTASVLAFGAFIGYPNDAALTGIFWLFTAAAVIMGGIAW